MCCEAGETKIMGHCKVIEDMLDEVRYNAKCEIALNMLIITNLSFADIAEVTELTVDKQGESTMRTNGCVDFASTLKYHMKRKMV